DASAAKLVEQVTRSFEALSAAAAPETETGVTEAEWEALSAEDDADILVDRAELRARRRSRPRPTGVAGVPSPADLFADWDTLARRLDQGTQLAELGVGDDLHVRCQPVIEMRGRVADWVTEIRRLRDEGEATLFVAATAGRAERTIELLKEYDVFALPVERAEDAQYAAVLVAVGGLSRGFRLPAAGLQIYAEPDRFDEERRRPD